MKKLPLSRRFHTFGLGCLMLATLLVPSLADPSEPFIRPEKVVSVTGNVQNATALAGGSGAATLTWTGSGPAPQIILDYGRDVGGLPVFDISIVAGTPKLTAIYSEAQSWLMPNGDGEAPGVPTDPAITPDEVSFVGNAGGSDLSRVKHLCRCKPGVILHPLIQGGERFQAITLTTPGSVTLRSVGIRSKIFHPRPSLNSGRFWSSDEALNEIWSLGEYTLHLNQVPARSLPTTWTATSEGVRVRGSQYSGYQGGADWTDYTSEFDVKILANEAAWLVRASSLDGLRIVLGANNAALGITQPNTIRAYSQARKALLGEAALPFDLRPGTWHHVRTVVGSTVQVYIDDQPVLTLDASNVAGLFGAPITAGWLGFGNVDGGDAVFRNLSVADTTGQTLYQSALKSASVLDQFAAGTNVLPVILDGAKRDRWVWAGDVAIAGLSLLYSNYAAEYVAGSVDIVTSYQFAYGDLPGFLAPQTRPGITPNGGAGPFSPAYTFDTIESLYNYYLYTGDKNFVRDQWPVVEKLMAYYGNLVNSQGLLEAPVLGSVAASTAGNAHYYAGLLQRQKLPSI